MNMIKTRILYRRLRVTVEIEKFGYCQACGQAGRTEMHHYEYKYSTKMVRKKPQLAVENIIELCYLCHRVADMIRKIVNDMTRFHRVFYAVYKKEGGNHVTVQPGRCGKIPGGAG